MDKPEFFVTPGYGEMFYKKLGYSQAASTITIATVFLLDERLEGGVDPSERDAESSEGRAS